jgi:uncharacterized protein YggE
VIGAPGARPAGTRLGGQPRGRGVVVVGWGRAAAAPDVARLQLAAEGVAPAVREALAAATEGLTAMRSAALAAGVAAADLRTSGTSLWSEQPSRGTTRFRARFSLTVTVRDVARAGDVLTAAMDAAGEAARMDGIGFAHSDPTALQAAARRAAFQDAVERAGQYAAAAGRELGPVLSVEEQPAAGIEPRHAWVALAAAESVPVDAGEEEVQAAVRVRWGWASRGRRLPDAGAPPASAD